MPPTLLKSAKALLAEPVVRYAGNCRWVFIGRTRVLKVDDMAFQRNCTDSAKQSYNEWRSWLKAPPNVRRYLPRVLAGGFLLDDDGSRHAFILTKRVWPKRKQQAILTTKQRKLGRSILHQLGCCDYQSGANFGILHNGRLCVWDWGV